MVAVVNYGAGNLRSLTNALDYLGVENSLVHSRAGLAMADRIILPGVGAFRYGMDQLRALGLVEYLKTTTKPLLGICLGMQLLAQSGEEGGETVGLARLPGRVVKLPEPHVGWDEWEGKDYYFVHHYAIEGQPWAIQQGNLWACQFHPEKSQQAGLDFLKEFCA